MDLLCLAVWVELMLMPTEMYMEEIPCIPVCRAQRLSGGLFTILPPLLGLSIRGGSKVTFESSRKTEAMGK